MNPLAHRRLSIQILAVTVGVFAAAVLLNIPSQEGFNPSDDGVILAQSYRILHGEIPHLDFISLRPVGSGWLHSIHFIGFLPLELSARWFVLLEYFLLSLFFMLAIWGFFHFEDHLNTSPTRFWPLLLVMFVGNQNYYNLFPWTTIDALLWTSIAFYGWMLFETGRCKRRFLWLPGVMILFGSVMAALSRQTFILPGLVFVLIYFVKSIKVKSYWSMLPGMIVGLLPLMFYLYQLINSQAIAAFFEQMTGRTELWETGFVKFWQQLWKSPFLLIPIIFVGTSLCGKWTGNKNGVVCVNDIYLRWIMRITGVVVLAVLIACFLLPDQLFMLSFQLFWLTTFSLIMRGIIGFRETPKWFHAAKVVVLIAWTSSISLGDNAPVFTIGLLAVAGFVVSFEASRTWTLLRQNRWIGHLLPFIALLIWVISLMVQLNNNYRDQGSRELGYDLGVIYPGLKGIHTQEQTYRYMEEINRIFQYFDNPVGRFSVWPDNAILYPLLNSPNPFPLDWMQQPEFAGNEDELYARLNTVLDKQGIIILLEKYNIKELYYERVAVDYNSSAYPYMNLLISKTEELPDDWEFFRVLVTK